MARKMWMWMLAVWVGLNVSALAFDGEMEARMARLKEGRPNTTIVNQIELDPKLSDNDREGLLGFYAGGAAMVIGELRKTAEVKVTIVKDPTGPLFRIALQPGRLSAYNVDINVIRIMKDVEASPDQSLRWREIRDQVRAEVEENFVGLNLEVDKMSKEEQEAYVERRLEFVKRNPVEYATDFSQWDVKSTKPLESRFIVSHSPAQITELLKKQKSVDGYILIEHRIDGKIMRMSAVPMPCRIVPTLAGPGILTNHYEFKLKGSEGHTAAYVLGSPYTGFLRPEGKFAMKDLDESVGALGIFNFGTDIPVVDHFRASQGLIELRYMPLTEVRNQQARDTKNLEPRKEK